MTLSPQFLDELRARTLLSGLIGKSVKLQRAGREWKACCPFHQEKTPSFTINDDKGFYHCFGCGAHGDAIRYLTESQGLSFMDAVRDLAQLAGMTVPAPDPRAAERAERQSGLHDVMAAAASWYEDQLGGLAGAEAREYLKRRGISDRLARDFGLGFAPDGGSRLKGALASAGIEKLVEAGLLISVDGKEPYDRFRGRLMIPIRDARGRTIAFGARIIGEGEPKYLNSPETPLFDKGRTLFNLDRAGPASRKSGRLFVVEGYMDVIALDSAGMEAVAPLGTALTDSQLGLLWRCVDHPILCFDGDSAGRRAGKKAAIKALPLLTPSKSLRIVQLPKGKDPDDLARSGGADVYATPLAEFVWKMELEAEPLDTPEARAGLRRRLADHAQAIQDRDVREQYLAEFRRRFDELYARRPSLPERPFRRQHRGGAPFRPPPRPTSDEARSIGSGGIDRRMGRAILAGLLRYPDLIASRAEAIAGLALGERALDRVRDLLLDRAFDGAMVESEALGAILAQAGLGDVAEELQRTNILAFSFLRSNADSDRARRDLGAAIEVLAARPQLDAALAAATERLMTAPDEAGFAEQRRLRAARDEADRSLAALAYGADGADIV